MFSLEYTSGSGVANGTFGELLQGVLTNGRNFMVTFPTQCYSRASFFPDLTSKIIEVFPRHKSKSHRMACELLRYFNVKIGGRLIIESDIPEGKGLASSSADLVATGYSISQAIKKTVSKKLLCDLIRHIEPSDGIMYPGIVSFYYKEIELVEFFGNLSTLTVVSIDEGGEVDTLKYNSNPQKHSEEEIERYNVLLKQISHAVKNRNLQEVGKSSTQSAIMNQKYNPKKYLSEVLSICKQANGLGIAVAHSGTFIGILLDNSNDNYYHQLSLCKTGLLDIGKEIHIFRSI